MVAGTMWPSHPRLAGMRREFIRAGVAGGIFLGVLRQRASPRFGESTRSLPKESICRELKLSCFG